MYKKFLKRKIALVVSAALVSLPLPQAATYAAADSAAKDPYQERFMEMWDELHDSSNGYFSKDGVPYHSIETLMVEAPDYGHVTTSEAVSYYMWLEAMYGKFTGDFSPFEKSWETTEKYMIPTEKDQPNSSMSKYKPSSPATYAGEWEVPDNYPSKLDSSAPVGTDPIHDELVSAYGTSTMYGMHWLMDVDNWYGFGQRGDGTSKNSYINTFQRGKEESTWETVPQPCWDAMKFGGKNGFLDIFTGDNSYSQQFKYTDAPDADSRAVQATYWANEWAKELGADVSTDVKKASKMGDYLRYSFFDKYFRKIGSPKTAGNGYDSASYLLSWYYAWGGGVTADWSWKIGCSHNHGGYQNPMAAWILSKDSDFKPKSKNGSSDWAKSLDRQLEFYQWLQSSEGAIAGGASNSYNGRYETWPAGTATFYGMGYEENPVYADPGSNTWFGFQAWSMQRVAEYYYKSQDPKAKNLLDKWAKWVKSVVKLKDDGTFEIPSKLDWDGQPDTWTGKASDNKDLHVIVEKYGTDLGVAGSLANALLYYSKASGDDESRVLAKELLDRIWKLYRDDKGVAVPEKRDDYHRFFDQKVYVPSGFSGKMPNGDEIKPGITFMDIRSKYKKDPDYQKLLDAYNKGIDPTFTYHRFWAQCDFAIANGVYAILFGDGGTEVTNATITPSSAEFDKANAKDVSVKVTLNGKTLSGIKNGTSSLVKGTDYKVSDDTVTIAGSYLAKQEVGTTKLTFDFDDGRDPALSVTVTDSSIKAADLSLKTDYTTWQGGYQMNFTVKNSTSSPINGWTLVLKKADFSINTIWGAKSTTSGDSIIITPEDYAKTIKANESVSFGLIGSGNPSSDFTFELK